MTKIQEELKALLEKDDWTVYMSQNKKNYLIMQKKINDVVVYVSIKEDGAVHFNRSKV
jgi:hypothetical protein